MTVRIVHVGLGGWGGNWARTVIPAVSAVDVVAIVDPHAPTLETVAAGIGVAAEASFASLSEANCKVNVNNSDRQKRNGRVPRPRCEEGRVLYR